MTRSGFYNAARSRRFASEFGARAFSVDERDDGNPLAPHLITAMSDVCADVDADRQQLSNRCTCPNYPSQMAGVFH